MWIVTPALLINAVIALSMLFGHISSAQNSECYDIPILVVHAKEPFPKPDCAQNSPLTYINCMKKSIHADLKLIENSQNPAENCIDQSSPSVKLESATVHYHGQSSLGLLKHQYTVNTDQPAEFFGLPEGKSWVLHGPFLDGSLMRNHLAHWLFRNTGRYSPRSRHIIMYLQEPGAELKYNGIYLLLEKISFEKNRLGLAKNNQFCSEKEMSGGWAWQYNPIEYGTFAPNFIIDKYEDLFGHGQRPVLEYPPGETLTQEMRNFFVSRESGPLPKYHQYLFNNMSAPDELGKHIDIGSFVDYALHTELSLNQDAYRRSMWYFKDRDEPINAGPVWDFNMAYGVGAMGTGKNIGWMFMSRMNWKRLLCNYKYTALIIQRWKTLRKSSLAPWSDESIRSFILQSAAPLKRILNKCKGVWFSQSPHCAFLSPIVRPNFDKEIEYLITTTVSRAQWMDQNIEGLYQKVDSTVCGGGSGTGKLPAYNCAADGNESGCLTNPAKFFNAVPFPPIHAAYNGPQCGSELMDNATAKLTVAQSLPENKQPSVDPCWLSVGFDVTGSYPTRFCSGYGRCKGGPNAVCECINDSNAPDCSPKVTKDGVDTSLLGVTLAESEPQQESFFAEIGSFLLMICMTFAIVLLIIYAFTCISGIFCRISEGRPLLGDKESRAYGTQSSYI